MREKAIAEYHDLLAADASLTADFFVRLRAAMRARRLVYGERELGVALRPHLLTHRQYRALARAAETIDGALRKVAAAALADESLMRRLGLTDSERRLALIHPGYASPAVTTRFDAFVHGDEIRFVEYNAENPSSLTDQEGLNQTLFEVPALALFAERYRLRQFDPARALLQTLLATYREWAGGSSSGTAPQIAIVDWNDLPTAHEFVLLRNYFAGCGVPTIICTPDELTYEGGRLRRGEFTIDLVYKRVIIHEFLARYDETHPLARAFVNRHVCLVNPFRCKLLHKKAVFERLTDEEESSIGLTTVERAAITRCVPWTRTVAERRTFYRGERVDLADFIRRNRERFVLKPNDDYGGHGVFFGPRMSAAEWDAALALALRSDYVVQELIELHTEEFPIFDENGWELRQMYVDTNPFLFAGKVVGAMVRLSNSPVVNVTSGGGETGFFVIAGPAKR